MNFFGTSKAVSVYTGSELKTEDISSRRHAGFNSLHCQPIFCSIQNVLKVYNSQSSKRQRQYMV